MLENLSSNISGDPIEKTKYEVKILEDLILSREDEIIDLIEEVSFLKKKYFMLLKILFREIKLLGI